MPALTPIDGLTYADVKVGDTILGSQVTGKRTGTKWVYLTFAGSERENRYDPAGRALVSRMMPTAEETAADRLAFALRQMDVRAEADRMDRASMRAALSRQAAVGDVSWSTLGGYPVAETKAALWDRVDRTHLNRTLLALDDAVDSEDARAADVPTRLEVLADEAQDVTTRLVDNTQYISQSTSAASNLLDNGHRQGMANWLRDVRWISL